MTIYIRPDGAVQVEPSDLDRRQARLRRRHQREVDRAEAKRIRALVQPVKNTQRLQRAGRNR